MIKIFVFLKIGLFLLAHNYICKLIDFKLIFNIYELIILYYYKDGNLEINLNFIDLSFDVKIKNLNFFNVLI